MHCYSRWRILTVSLLMACACCTARAAEPQWWTRQKLDCGLDKDLAYETWRQQKFPCPGAATGSVTNPAAASTGSLTGDVLNLGANLWIIQNVKNPYTAVFAQHFSQGFLTALFSNGNADPEVQRRQRLAWEANQRQQQEAAERARIEEQQRVDAMFARLNNQLKLSGTTMQLAPKTEGQAGALALKLSNSDSVGGLKLKLGDDSTTGYGVQGLPGIYVDGPAPAAAEDGGGLKFKLGESSASSATATPQPVPSMGIPGLPGLNLASVEPSQAAQLAETASTLTGTERVTLEDAALQAARKNPGLTAPGDDPFVADYRKEAQGYDAALQQRQQALQKASEAEGHIQADLSAINYAQGQIKAGNATEAQKQDFQQMLTAAHSDEDAAVAARQMFEQADAHLSIVRNRASDALSSLAPPARNPGISMNGNAVTPSPPRLLASNSLPVIAPSARPAILATPPPGGKPYVMSVGECVASYSPTGSVPTLEDLNKKLEFEHNALAKLLQTQTHEQADRNEWLDEMRKAAQDAGMNSVDRGVDGLFRSTKDGLNRTVAALDMEATELTTEARLIRQKLAEAREAMNSAKADPQRLAALQADWDIFDKNQVKPLLERRKQIQDQLEKTELLKGRVDNFETGRDFGLWLSDFAQGDLVTQLDLLKQVLKFGVHFSPTIKALSYGTLVGEVWDTASLTIDLTYDGTAFYLGYRRLQQVKENSVLFEKAKSVLGARIDRTNAEIDCYRGTH